MSEWEKAKRPNLLQRAVYWFGFLLFNLTLPFYLRLKVRGRENVPRKGPLIVASNHISYLDPPVIGAAVPRILHYMAKSELFRIPVFNGLIRFLNAYPVRRGKPDRRALKYTLDLLMMGEAVLTFPEGTRSRDGRLRPPEPGTGFIALMSRAPVLPVGVVGTDKALPQGCPFLLPRRVEVRIGKPLTFPDLYGKPSREGAEEASWRIMEAIARLLDKEPPPRRGVKRSSRTCPPEAFCKGPLFPRM